MRLHFVWIGRTKDRRCAGLVEDYVERIRRFVPVEISELREPGGSDPDQIIQRESVKLCEAIEKDDLVVLLDERGREMTSTELADFIGRKQSDGTKRLAIVIGGFAGVDQNLKNRADTLLSLSRLTLTHEMARVILTEQLYRAFTILAGFPYHKV